MASPAVIGTCVNSFDEEGDCINSLLPFSDVTDFAQHVEEHGDDSVVGTIIITYDPDSDIHTFWS